MPILGAFVALAAVEFSYFPGRDSRLHVAALRAKGVALAELTAGSIAPALEFEDDSVLLEFLNGVARDRDVAKVLACTADGAPLRGVGPAHEPSRCPRVSATHVDLAGSLMSVSTPVSAKSHPGVLTIALRVDAITAARSDAQRVALGIAAGILILGFIVTGWIARILARLERLLEENRAARARAEAASAAKSAFLANMSHEIRTPMNGVIGLTQLLEKGALDETQRRHVRTIARSGEVLMAVINDILDFSKIEAGKLTVSSVPLDLHALLNEVADSVRAAAEQKAIALHVEIDAALPRAVSADSVRLRQVLSNLLANAIKFTHRGSVRLTARGDGDAGAEQRVRFEVTDTGIGIAEADQPKLFEAFSQVDDHTTRRYGGTGLGLAICKRLVTLMNGELGVRSRPGAGSTFWFLLPLPVVERVSVAPTSGDTVSGERAKTQRLLAVDDNEINRGVIEHLAEALGYAV
jgi:signal transduction histidine kinase